MVHTINTKEHFFDAITLMKITHHCIFPELANKKNHQSVYVQKLLSTLSIFSKNDLKQTKTKKENKRNKHTNNSFLFL